MSVNLVVIGNFGKGGGNCGQTIKTNAIYNLLRDGYSGEVVAFNTSKLNSPCAFIKLLLTILRNKKFIVLPAQRALPVIAMLFFLLRKKADYIVIGGWLPSYYSKTNSLIRNAILRNFRVFVETDRMKSKLEGKGLGSMVLPNTKGFEILALSDVLKARKISPSNKRFVYVGRVIEEKGCVDAMIALNNLAAENKGKKFIFHLYGPLPTHFEQRFNEAVGVYSIDNLQIACKGFIEPAYIQSTLLAYDAFLFPTYYQGEGLAGSMVDALSAGLPIVASDWKYNSEIVKPGVNGYLFESRNASELLNMLMSICNLNDIEYSKLVSNCLSDALKYHESNTRSLLTDYDIV